MIELSIEHILRNLFPTVGGVAGLAVLREGDAMRIMVAIVAFAKRNSGVARFSVWSRSMTSLARHLGMQAGQGITRLRVVELADRKNFPVVVTVALEAVGTETTLMLILMARSACLRQS